MLHNDHAIGLQPAVDRGAPSMIIAMVQVVESVFNRF
jgi:hypothetical protein